MPKRERYLWVCTNERAPGHPKGSCAEKGSVALLDALKKATLERGLRTKVRVCSSGCLDLCWAGISIAVEPDNVFYGRVQTSDVDEIADALVRSETVPRLVLAPADFDDPEKERK